MNTLCTIIIWGGMYYATPKWMEDQVPEWMWSRYEIYVYSYNKPLTIAHDPKTTALIGFSAGGLDVLKNYRKDYAFVGLIDPSTREKFTTIEYGANAHMMYNHRNWGTSNKSLRNVADRINKTGGKAEHVNLPHADIPKQFFKTYFHE
jgi:hypothetical protein